MKSKVRIPLRLGVAAAGVAVVIAGVAVVGASGEAVGTSSSFGYLVPPAAYDVGNTATFSYTVTNLTGSTITATLDFNTSRITSLEGIDVSTGYPALTELELAQNWWNTVQVFDIPNQYKYGFTLPPMGSETVTFTTVSLTQCGYYQLDSEAEGSSASGLFATGFIRVIGCTSPTSTPTPTPTPGEPQSPTATPTDGLSPTATASPPGSSSPSPNGGTLALTTPSPTGGVGAASTPDTGTGAATGTAGGIAIIVLGVLLVIGGIFARRRHEPI